MAIIFNLDDTIITKLLNLTQIVKKDLNGYVYIYVIWSRYLPNLEAIGEKPGGAESQFYRSSVIRGIQNMTMQNC